MSSWRDWLRRRARQDAELDEEIRSHLMLAVRDRIARGEQPAEAERAARREFGNVGLVREVTREMWGGAAIERLQQDLRFAARSLRRSPAFSIAAVLTLALGIGLTTSIFSVVHGIVLRPLAFPDPGRLVTLCEQYPGSTSDWCSISPPNVEDIAVRSRTIEAVGIGRSWSALMATPQGGVTLPSGIATAGMFRALGVPAEMGRVLEPGDLTGRNGPVAVITHEMWQSRFGGARDIVGRVITLDRKPVTIVGVMPPGFEVPMFEWVELWQPLNIDPRDEQHRAWRGFVAYTRLRPGVSLGTARADLGRIATQLEREHFATTPRWGITMEPLHDLVVGGVRRTLLLFMGAVLLVLLVGCANVANLLLARGTARRRELALRAALGAGPARIARGLLAEGLLLSLSGAAMGIGLALAATAAFRALAPGEIPRVSEVRVDLQVLAFTVLLAMATTLVFGLLPSIRAARVDVSDGLREGGRAHTTRDGRLAAMLVVGELALALVLLTGAGLLTRTFAALSAWSPGFEQAHLLTFSLSASSGSYKAPRDVNALWLRVTDALRSIPGVVAVGSGSGGPVFGGYETAEVHVPGRSVSPGGESVRWFDVSPRFFATLGIPVVRGRDLDARDVIGAPATALVNESLARHFWPGADPTGRQIDVALGPDTTAFTVVGVVRDVPPLTPGAAIEPQLYWSNRQQPRWFTYFVVRTTLAPAALTRSIRRRVASVDRDLDPGNSRTMPELVSRKLVDPRFFMLLLVTFGVAALLLAAIGTYGLLAYLVSQRQREIGIRLALGAWRGRILRDVLREGLGLAATGLAIGLGASLALGRTMAHLVAGVSTHDPLALGGAATVLLTAALAACLLPALRASRVAPTVALQAE